MLKIQLLDNGGNPRGFVRRFSHSAASTLRGTASEVFVV